MAASPARGNHNSEDAQTVTEAPVLIAWHRFGPYHHARADAARRVLPIVTLEMSAVDKTYLWDTITTKRPDHLTLFNEDIDDVPIHHMRRVLRATLDRIAPSTVAAPGWSEPWEIMILEWALDHGASTIVMSDSNIFDAPRRVLGEWIKRRVVSRFSSGLAAGAASSDYLVQLGMDRNSVFVGYDVIDNSHFQSSTSPPDKLPGILRHRSFFLSCTRFVAKKNLTGLLAAYASYRQRAGSEAWALIVLGDGPLREELEAQQHSLGLTTDVAFPGFKQYDELPAWYAAATAFILPSTVEQWGLVVNEAMAAGLPVLVSRRCGCAADLVLDGQNGLLFNPFRTEDIAEALWRMAHGDGDREAMGAKSLEIIRDWGPDRFASGLKNAVAAASNAPQKTCSYIHRALFHALTRT